jgi:hypothetical protein
MTGVGSSLDHPCFNTNYTRNVYWKSCKLPNDFAVFALRSLLIRTPTQFAFLTAPEDAGSGPNVAVLVAFIAAIACATAG